MAEEKEIKQTNKENMERDLFWIDVIHFIQNLFKRVIKMMRTEYSDKRNDLQ